MGSLADVDEVRAAHAPAVSKVASATSAIDRVDTIRFMPTRRTRDRRFDMPRHVFVSDGEPAAWSRSIRAWGLGEREGESIVDLSADLRLGSRSFSTARV